MKYLKNVLAAMMCAAMVITGLLGASSMTAVAATDEEIVAMENLENDEVVLAAVAADGADKSGPYLDNTEFTLAPGAVKTIPVQNKVGTPVYTSSDPSVVKIMSQFGVFKAVSAGKAVITVEVDGITLTCNVTVTEMTVDNLMLYPGQSKTIVVSGNVGELTYESQDPTIATVAADGTVTGVSKGDTMINVSDDCVTLSCIVQVGDAPALTLTEAKLRVGDTVTIKVRNTFATPVYETADATIATVEMQGRDAVVTAKAVGETVIYAHVEDLTLPFAVTVVDDPYLQEDSATIRPCGKANIVVENCINTPVYTSSDEMVAIVDANGCITGVAEGQTQITVTVDNYTLIYTVTVLPQKEPIPTDLPFDDVSEDAWYYGVVSDVFQKGLMTGMNATTFAPDLTLNRAFLAAVLYRRAGYPAVEFSPIFFDVSDGEWFTQCVLWAKEAGVILGYDEGTFGPTDSLKREQLCTILWRCALEMDGLDNSARVSIDGYPDAENVTAFAVDAIEWCEAMGILNYRDGRIAAWEDATRADCAWMISKYLEATGLER